MVQQHFQDHDTPQKISKMISNINHQLRKKLKIYQLNRRLEAVVIFYHQGNSCKVQAVKLFLDSALIIKQT